MAIAIDKLMVQGVDDSIWKYLPGLPKDGKEKIKIKDLLNMRSGLDADDEDPATPGNAVVAQVLKQFVLGMLVGAARFAGGLKMGS